MGLLVKFVFFANECILLKKKRKLSYLVVCALPSCETNFLTIQYVILNFHWWGRDSCWWRMFVPLYKDV